MRIAIGSSLLALVLAAGAAVAQTAATPTTGQGTRTAPTAPGAAAPAAGTAARTTTAPPASPAKVKAMNEEAQREAIAREKRWDERMRRITGSMCDRC